MAATIIQKSQFGGHDSFHLRTGWLKKAFNGVETDTKIFSQKHATELFGVGRNMVNAIRHWSVSADVLQVKNNEYFQSDFGKLIFSADPYLEDTSSLWLLHYHLVTNPKKCTLWNWAFNYLNHANFDKNLVSSSVVHFLSKHEHLSENSSKTIEGDFAAFIKTYCERDQAIDTAREDVIDSPFSALELINSTGKGSYRFKIGPKKELPKEVIAYSILKPLKDAAHNSLGAQSINLDDLLNSPQSPGRVFKLDPETLIHYIEDICSSDLLGNASYSISAGIKQLMLNDFEELEPGKIIETYLESK
jgi:hypothetical protein